ncbi:MAG TPA: protein-tyrosine-phosphatase [Chryseosolibacter sp.]|nr:protein-tyrosine-phosphatase [Chryseosolibacter sp.]
MTTIKNDNSVLLSLLPTITKLASAFNDIPAYRKVILDEVTEFVSQQRGVNQKVNLNFICTHNSRRSHIAQIWAQTAARYYGIANVHCYSGGTEATAFNPRAVKAMKESGFDIQISEAGSNPVYSVKFSNEMDPLTVFSKKYDDAFNPNNDFAAIMTCSHADENCPLVLGATKRIALTYNDPKDFDGTPQEAEKYTERVHEIGREILFAFSQVR